MMNNYDLSFEYAVSSEGGFQNDPNDRGNWTSGKIGVGQNKGTKYGVSAMSYPNLDIRGLTKDKVKPIYKKDYWDANRCDELPIGVDYLVFDISINHGVRDGATFLQRAIGATADGAIGPATLKLLASKDPQHVIEEICVIRAFDYISLGTFKRYGVGWFRRIMDTLTRADDMLDAPLDKSKVPSEQSTMHEYWFRRV